ncbi:MAG: hypothetical protein AUK34_14930 [Ignavibacteria bacterium CG2_30_36_16]|nr:Hsp70 family protein [Ignavibacteria bacterium]OIP54650.1 MAG: hypothetical protein AUK34_14930 [Ignavibacteria bacterium CG2_30_36_16]PJB00252.1 MAG: heat-shock protein Hsp70 [Ignavibacteria bacterium CG_4_9_14_3_um_filter_36_18]
MKLRYGIALTNDQLTIARMENGEPVTKKTDTLRDAMPLFVSFNKKGSVTVGDAAKNCEKNDRLIANKSVVVSATNTFSGFLRTIGTDKKYASSNVNKEFSSEELLAECFKKAKTFVFDEELNSAVITVPSKFTINQKTAILNAAKLADYKQIELLQEPIAASMAYGIDSSNKDGLWLVFNFGDGAFDAALLKVEDGIINVIDTEEDNYLGGKNIDYAIVDEILIPYLQKNFSIDSIINDNVKREVLRDSIKHYAEETKIQLNSNHSHSILTDLGDITGEDDKGTEFELDISITQEDLLKVVSPIFHKAIGICKELLNRNNIAGGNLGALILVGRQTYSPILREMLKEQVTEKIDTSCDPMSVVAKGAALYASTIDSEIADDVQFELSPIYLQVGYEATTIENEEFVTLKILKEKTEATIPDKCFTELVRCDRVWSSGKIAIDEKGEVLEVALNSGKTNRFKINLYDNFGNKLFCYPNEFSIIQGQKVGSTTLPYNIGIEIKSKASGKIVFRPIKGLEKNQSTPAFGIINGIKTDKDIFPGDISTFIKIPIYQGDYGAEGSRVIYNEHVFDIVISGENLPSFLPAGSDIDITIKVDKSERVFISAFFPCLNYTEEVIIPETVQKEIDAKWLETEISKAKQTLNIINQECDFADKDSLNKLSNELTELEKLLEQGGSDYDCRKQVIDNLRRILRKLDDIQDSIFPCNTDFNKEIEELKTSLVNSLQEEHIGLEIFNEHFDFLFELSKSLNGNIPTREQIEQINGIKNLVKDE